MEQIPLEYGSVCSGIEAVSLAWKPLGWRPAWFSEIDPFPNAVLAHHYPEVPTLGDMTGIADRVRAGTAAAPDILVGGTPCQAFFRRRRAPGTFGPARCTHSQIHGACRCHRPDPQGTRPATLDRRLGKRARSPFRQIQRLRMPSGLVGRRRLCARTGRATVDERWLCCWTPPSHRVAGAQRAIFRSRPTTPSRVSCGKWSRRPRSRRGTI